MVAWGCRKLRGWALTRTRPSSRSCASDELRRPVRVAERFGAQIEESRVLTLNSLSTRVAQARGSLVTERRRHPRSEENHGTTDEGRRVEDGRGSEELVRARTR